MLCGKSLQSNTHMTPFSIISIKQHQSKDIRLIQVVDVI